MGLTYSPSRRGYPLCYFSIGFPFLFFAFPFISSSLYFHLSDPKPRRPPKSVFSFHFLSLYCLSLTLVLSFCFFIDTFFSCAVYFFSSPKTKPNMQGTCVCFLQATLSSCVFHYVTHFTLMYIK